MKENLAQSLPLPLCLRTHQKGTEHVEADKVNDGKLAAAVLVGRAVLIGRSFLTWPIKVARQHDLLPGLTCGTSDR